MHSKQQTNTVNAELNFFFLIRQNGEGVILRTIVDPDPSWILIQQLFEFGITQNRKERLNCLTKIHLLTSELS